MAKRVSVEKFASEALKKYGRTALDRDELKALSKETGFLIPQPVWRNKGEQRGTFVIGENVKAPVQVEAPKQAPVAQVAPVATQAPTVSGNIKAIRNVTENFNETVNPRFIRWGNYRDILAIIKSRRFFPAFVTGMSGNGKTFSILQACAQANREVIRVNFTRETNEDDLVGGLRLTAGETVFQYGPVAEAYMRGAVLLLDEIDVADTNKVMVLQAVLEGQPIFIKKLGERIAPKAGFTVFATANTKGKGSVDGRFVGTNTLNEAFLDRFPITVEQNYPTPATEVKMVTGYAEDYSDDGVNDGDKEIIKNLVQWAQTTRKCFDEGGIDELISTRRIVATVESYFIFSRDIEKAIGYAVNRFDDDIKESFIELYKQIDGGLNDEVDMTV